MPASIFCSDAEFAPVAAQFAMSFEHDERLTTGCQLRLGAQLTLNALKTMPDAAGREVIAALLSVLDLPRPDLPALSVTVAGVADHTERLVLH